MSPLTEPTKLTLAKTYVGIDDPDAADYIAAVEAADEAASPGVGALETATKVAIHSFVKGCKADGIWPAIKASCILAGARTLEGALVPLAGTAPNKFGTAANWNYNRKTGLQGDGSTNYLDTNRNNNADPQNNMHLAIFASLVGSGLKRYIGAYSGAGTADDFLDSNGDMRCRSVDTPGNLSVAIGFYGASRTGATAFTARTNLVTVNGLTGSSVAPGARNHFVFAQNNNGSGYGFSNGRLAFYSIGEALDLALLDTRVSDLITAFGVAIP